MTHISKNWYPDPEYQEMNPREKSKFLLNQQEQKKLSGRTACKPAVTVNAVLVSPTQISAMISSIAGLETLANLQDHNVKDLTKQLDDSYGNDNLFEDSDRDAKVPNHNNGYLVRGSLKQHKRAHKSKG